jgi:hypothetical protein
MCTHVPVVGRFRTREAGRNPEIKREPRVCG